MPAFWKALRACTNSALKSVSRRKGRGHDISSYVIREAARVMKKRAMTRMLPDMPDARRLQGASTAVKSPRTSNTKAIR
jgi:hypothetical protein